MYKFRINYLDINKELSVALTSIYGLNWYKSNFILAKLGFPYPSFVNDLNNYYKTILFFYLEDYIISKPHIDKNIEEFIRKLKDLQTYRGTRHTLFLPVHGQRTRTNANTQKNTFQK